MGRCQLRRFVDLLLVATLLLLAMLPAGTACTEAPPAASPTVQQPTAAERQDVTTYTLPPDKYERAIAYSRAKYALYVVGVAYDIVVLLLVLAWCLGPRFRDWAERASPRALVQAMIFAPL